MEKEKEMVAGGMKMEMGMGMGMGIGMGIKMEMETGMASGPGNKRHLYRGQRIQYSHLQHIHHCNKTPTAHNDFQDNY